MIPPELLPWMDCGPAASDLIGSEPYVVECHGLISGAFYVRVQTYQKEPATRSADQAPLKRKTTAEHAQMKLY